MEKEKNEVEEQLGQIERQLLYIGYHTMRKSGEFRHYYNSGYNTIAFIDDAVGLLNQVKEMIVNVIDLEAKRQAAEDKERQAEEEVRRENALKAAHLLMDNGFEFKEIRIGVDHVKLVDGKLSYDEKASDIPF